MAASKAYILVTLNEPVKNLTGNLYQNFVFKKNNVTLIPQPTNVFIPELGNQYAGKILAELNNDQVPKVGEKITVEYTRTSSDVVKRDNRLKNLTQGGEAKTPDLKIFDYNSDAQSFVDSTLTSQLPQILSIDAPDVSGGRQIIVTLTSGRDICDNYIGNGEGHWGISVTPNPNGSVVSVAFPDTIQTQAKIALNQLEFVALQGAIQKGATYTVEYTPTTRYSFYCRSIRLINGCHRSFVRNKFSSKFRILQCRGKND